MGVGRLLGSGFGAFGLGAGGGGVPQPPALGLFYRYDAEAQRIADSIADGTAVDTIKNRAAGDGDLAKFSATGTVLKTGIRNGKAVFRFANSEKHRDTNTTGVGGDANSMTVYAVLKNSTTNTLSRYAYTFNDPGGIAFGLFKNGSNVWESDVQGDNIAMAGSNDTSWRMLTQVFMGDTHSFYSARTLVGSNGTIPPIAATVSFVYMGIRGSTGNLFVGDIAEILVYDDAHDADKRGEVWDYLENRWGSF